MSRRFPSHSLPSAYRVPGPEARPRRLESCGKSTSRPKPSARSRSTPLHAQCKPVSFKAACEGKATLSWTRVHGRPM